MEAGICCKIIRRYAPLCSLDSWIGGKVLNFNSDFEDAIRNTLYARTLASVGL
jgi:hypothetical protein